MKKSVAYDHFPQVVPQGNRFWLFNPILKKRYENRPEERVRLKWVEYLRLQTDWKRTRIGFETPVKLQQRKNTLRADLVLYSDSVKPSILVECKSNSVKLNHSTAEQAARYNSEVNADHLVLTNGIEDYWFKRIGNNINQTTSILKQQTYFKDLDRNAAYWQKRGFYSTTLNAEVNSWFINALNFFWSDELDGTKQYLDFQTSVISLPMNQYYKLFELDSERRLAVSFLGADSSDSFLIAILNSGEVNKGIVTINLDKLHSGEQDSSTTFKKGKRRSIRTEDSLEFTFSDFEPAQIKNLPQTLMNFFD